MRVANLTRLTLLLLLSLGIVLAIVYRGQFHGAALESWLDSAGVAAPVVFMSIYTLAPVLFLPGSVLTLAGGALFGPIWGTLYSLTGATLGATLAFLVARYLARDWVARKSGGRLKQLIEGVESEGWRFVAFVRLVPLFPFNLLNYALGLTRIRLSHYVITSYVCMLPGAGAYTYLGYAGREAMTGDNAMIQKGLLALGLLALLVFLPRFITRLRQQRQPVPLISVPELKARLNDDKDILVLDVRGPNEYTGELGHILCSRNISVEELQRRLGELAQDRERPITIVCRTDRRSLTAAEILNRAGFSHVAVLQGGMVEWNRSGLPVERVSVVTDLRYP
jgi:uncharacterized membrane protein YdjX (TVP38/TMEM64 family)